jgi:hypothetical protein
LVRDSAALACASTPVAARDSASACSACSLRSTSSSVASGVPAVTNAPTSTRRFNTFPPTRNPSAFDPRADGADEGAVAGLGFVVDGSDQNGPDGGSVLGGDLVTPGKRQRQRSRRRDLR